MTKPDHNPYSSAYNPAPKPDPLADQKVTYSRPPAVIAWQMVYCGVMLAFYFCCSLMGLYLFLGAEEMADVDLSINEARIFGVIFMVVGFGLAALFATGLFWQRGTGGWVFHIVLISIGLTSACCWPSNIPLLIFWCKHKDYIIEGGK